MHSFINIVIEAFSKSIYDYNFISKDIPYDKRLNFCAYNTSNNIFNILYKKNRIDSIQWSMEDEIRDPNIDPIYALNIKRNIDKFNQFRTNIVEDIDSFFEKKYSKIEFNTNARLNTESPAWALDRLSILMLKIHYISSEFIDVKNIDHLILCQKRIYFLQIQLDNLKLAISNLLYEIESGQTFMISYKQMKMYNDKRFNKFI